MRKTQMKLGLSMRYLGYHDAAWRHPEVPARRRDAISSISSTAPASPSAASATWCSSPTASASARAIIRRGSLARIGLRNRRDGALTLLRALAVVDEPHRARRDRLDHLQRALPHRPQVRLARPYQRRPGRLEHRHLVVRAPRRGTSAATRSSTTTRATTAPTEFVEVVTGLWDSWEDDAFVLDKRVGQFFDAAKLHVLDHAASTSRCAARSTSPPRRRASRSWCRPGASEQGQEFAAANAEVVFAAQQTLAGGQGLLRRPQGAPGQVRPRAGRPEGPARRHPPIVGRTRAEAQAKFDQLQELIDPLVGLRQPVQQRSATCPAIRWTGRCRNRSQRPRCAASPTTSSNLAQRENLTIRQLYRRSRPAGGGHRC